MIFGKRKEAPPEPAKKGKKRDATTATEPAPKPAKPKEALLRERLADGWIRVLTTFEVAGKPKEHVEETIKAYLANIKSDGRVLTIKEEYGETEEQEDGVFSAFCELEAAVYDLETLTWLAVNFMPAAIEILEPDRPSIEARNITNWYNDLLAKLHEVSNVLREERVVNAGMTKSLNALIKNAIVASLGSGQKTAEQLQGTVGIHQEQLEPFLKHLLEKKTIVQRGKAYALP